MESNLIVDSGSQQQIELTNSLSIVDERNSANKSTWTIEDSKGLYGVEGWGEPYFSINAAGNITVAPGASRFLTIDLYELVESLKQRNIQLPLLIRFSDILADRMKCLYACMHKAIACYNYSGKYQGVFPLKCNQHRHLIEDLVHNGKSYNFELEVGSKPELIIMRRRTEIALRENRITIEEAQKLLRNYERELSSYTYLLKDIRMFPP